MQVFGIPQGSKSYDAIASRLFGDQQSLFGGVQQFFELDMRGSPLSDAEAGGDLKRAAMALDGGSSESTLQLVQPSRTHHARSYRA